jgi:hypothetical protein
MTIRSNLLSATRISYTHTHPIDRRRIGHRSHATFYSPYLDAGQLVFTYLMLASAVLLAPVFLLPLILTRAGRRTPPRDADRSARPV